MATPAAEPIPLTTGDDGVIRVAGTRVTLDTVIASFADGGTAEEGLFRVVPPSPRGIIMPPSNDNVRGQTIQVWVFVDERGRVVADSTQLRPPTSDGDFSQYPCPGQIVDFAPFRSCRRRWLVSHRRRAFSLIPDNIRP